MLRVRLRLLVFKKTAFLVTRFARNANTLLIAKTGRRVVRCASIPSVARVIGYNSARMTARATHLIARRVRDEVPVQLTFTHVVWIFVACSVVGLFVEAVVSFFIDGRWESRAGFVLLPLSPIYGVGALLITAFVNPLRGEDPVIQFAVAALVGGLFEYVAGWFFEWRYGIVAWSYASQPMNFHGHTCVGMMAVWGVIGVVWVQRLLPHAVALVERIPDDMRHSLTTIAFALIVADAACTLTALDCWFMRVSGLEPASPIQQFFATCFSDSFMSSRFETMSMWPVLASR